MKSVTAAMAVAIMSSSVACGVPKESPRIDQAAAAVEQTIGRRGNLRSALAGCVAANALFVSSTWSGDRSAAQDFHLEYDAAGCYDAYVRRFGDDTTIPSEERLAIALTAERSVLAIDPDPASRLVRASHIADVASQIFRERSDGDGAVRAKLRAAWYETHAAAPDVVSTSNDLWNNVQQADDAYLQQEAAKNAALVAAINNIGGSLNNAMVMAGGRPNPQLQQQQQLQQTIVATGVAITEVAVDLAQGRADLDTLLKGGASLLHDLMPKISARLDAIRDLPAAKTLVGAVDAASRGDARAGERVLEQMANAFGAELPSELGDVARAAVAPKAAVKTIEEKLAELKKLFDQGLITQKEFDERRKKLLDQEVGP
jgi:hypothetical protein